MAVTAILRSVGLFLAITLVSSVAKAEDQPDPSDPARIRVRSGSARLAALIHEATMRSPTFTSLVEAISATDGIVFVDEGTCPRALMACLRWQVTLAGPYRLLFVTINPQRSDTDLMASVGHELQHALEVLSNPSVRSNADIHFLYMRGPSPETLRAVETAAAQAATNAILVELRRSRVREQK